MSLHHPVAHLLPSTLCEWPLYLKCPLYLHFANVPYTLMTAHFYKSPMCCSVLQGVAMCCSVHYSTDGRDVLQCDAMWCSVLQCVVVLCNVVQCVAVCCSVLQCVAVCCSVLQCALFHRRRRSDIKQLRLSKFPTSFHRSARRYQHVLVYVGCHIGRIYIYVGCQKGLI